MIMMQSPSPSPQPLTPQQESEQRLEAERMQEIMFLLKHLLEREEATVKAILSCVLDVGSVHFINDRVKIRPLRPLARPLAKLSKPALVFVAHRWVHKKCPLLITHWIQRRILLKTTRPQPQAPQTQAPQTQTVQAPPQATIEPTVMYQHEIRRLRSRVQLTTGALVGVSSILVLGLIGIDLKSVNQFWQSAFANQTTAFLQTQSPNPRAIKSYDQSHGH
jgi:hypothetical protein